MSSDESTGGQKPAFKERARDWLHWVQLPAKANAILRNDRKGLPGHDPGPARVVRECIDWLWRAQDSSLSHDGGVARHFSLIDGWATSYPETTGYIVPTLITYGLETGEGEPIARAVRMLDWLISIQFPDGGFQGGTVHQEPRVPVTFNSGQVLIGLAAGARLDSRYRDAMRRTADWLVATQDEDGCWRKHPTPFAASGEKSYETHVALGLMDAASVDADRGYLEAGLRQVDWALKNQAVNGWLAHCCLSDSERPLTHTLGYALRGIVEAYHASKDDRYLQAACLTADGMMRALGHDGKLAGRFDAQWRPAVDWVCLTGASQIALSWLLLYKATGKEQYLQAARRTNAFVRRTVSVDGPPEIRGGVKGSFPVDGGYGRWQYLNWACKFTIDANRAEMTL